MNFLKTPFSTIVGFTSGLILAKLLGTGGALFFIGAFFIGVIIFFITHKDDNEISS